MNKIEIFSDPSYCPPCKVYKKTYDVLKEDFPDQVTIHDTGDLAVKEHMYNNGIRNIPTTVFDNGDKVAGALSYRELKEYLEDEKQ